MEYEGLLVQVFLSLSHCQVKERVES